MKLGRPTLLLVMILLGTMVSVEALARGQGARSGGRHFSGHHFKGHHFSGPHVRFGVFVGAPAFWYYTAPYPPVVAMPSSLPAYIEQGDAQSASQQPEGDGYYYCVDAEAYYPYVQQCPGGWQRVAPQPPPGP